MYKLSTLQIDVLTVLATAEEALYGLDILFYLNRGRSRDLTVGSLYPTLERLLDLKYASYKWGDGYSKGARRKYYGITEEGQVALERRREYLKTLERREVYR